MGFRVILVTDALCSSADETHDAMMNIYMNRFGLQVETITTESCWTAGPAVRGQAGSHERGPTALSGIGTIIPRKNWRAGRTG